MDKGRAKRRCYSIPVEYSRKTAHGVRWAWGTEHQGGRSRGPWEHLGVLLMV